MTATAGVASRDLRPLFAPTSVAVVGASDDVHKWGNWLASGAVRGEHRRAVHLVNRRGGEILGRPAQRSLHDLDEPAELVVLTVPETAVEATVDDALATGAKAILVITSGISATREATLCARVRESGAVLVGPNCLGVFDAEAELRLTSNDLPAGPIAMISQSGNLALEIGVLAAEVGLGFSRFVSVGNQADVTAAELIDAMVDHAPTRTIALYIEDFRDGRAFARAAARAEARGKAVVLLTVDAAGAAARAVHSHTGALASDDAAITAACAAAGIERVRSPRQLVDVVQGLVRTPAPRGRRVAVMGDGGGHGVIAAALATQSGLEVPELSLATATAVAAPLPPAAACTNPIDLAGGGEQDLRNFEYTARTLLESGEVDSVLLTGYFGGYGEYSEVFAEEEVETGIALAESAAAAGRPLVAQTMYVNSAAAAALRQGGVPVYPSIEQATDLLGRLADRGARALEPIPELPTAALAVGETGYAAARKLFARAGVPFLGQRTAATVEEARAAARKIGYPVVLKALGLLHKSDAGGVHLGLADDAALDRAYADVHARLTPSHVSIEAMAAVADGVELLVGARWDPRFGPIALVGLGGLYTEILRDVAVALAPVDASQAERMLRRLRAFPLLDGARGRPRLDAAAAARALAALSSFAAAHPEIAECEVNPLLVLPDGAVALDARIVPAAPRP